jgi:hypothetical protein
MTTRSVILLYRATCAKCRVLSLMLVWLSLGWVRRLPLMSPEAAALYEAHSLQRGKLAVIGYGRIFTGWRAFPGIAVLAALAICSRPAKKRT